MFNPFETPARFLFIETTSECNLKCKQCHMWMSKEEPDSLTIDEKLDLIHQFKKFNTTNGIVVLTGGETMLKTEEFFAMTSLCRELGLYGIANSNATMINEDNYDRVLTEGPHSLVISLDSHIESIHDYIRGVKGSYKHTTKVLRDLAALKAEKYPDVDTRVQTNSVLFDRNMHLWNDYIAFAKTDLKIDGVLFQALSRTFWNKAKKGDPFFEKHFFTDKEAAKDQVDSVIAEYGDDNFLLTSKNDLEWMKLYIDNPFFIGEQVCGSHERNIMVNQYGEVQLCFAMRYIMDGKTLGSTRKSNIKDLWTSDFAGEARELMGNCRWNCGMLNCHKKVDY